MAYARESARTRNGSTHAGQEGLYKPSSPPSCPTYQSLANSHSHQQHRSSTTRPLASYHIRLFPAQPFSQPCSPGPSFPPTPSPSRLFHSFSPSKHRLPTSLSVQRRRGPPRPRRLGPSQHALPSLGRIPVTPTILVVCVLTTSIHTVPITTSTRTSKPSWIPM